MRKESLSISFAEKNDSTIEFYKIFISDSDSLFLEFLSKNTRNDLETLFSISEIKNNGKPEEILLGIKTKIEKIKDVGKLWKNLLIDSIYFLRINDSRERLFYSEVDGNTKQKSKLNDKDVYSVKRVNTFGIDDLYAYFNQFTEFESILYGSDKFYRDHIIHPINVWIIGLHIIKKFGSSFKLLSCDKIEVRNTAYIDCCNNIENLNFCGEEKMPLAISELSAMWTIMSLTHDIGYPLEKVEKINDQLEKMLSQFGKIKFNRSNFSFENRHDNLVNFLIDFISADARLENKKEGNKWLIHKRWKFWSKFSKSWEAYDHGIVSSLILLKSLTFFIEADFATNSHLTKNEDARQFAIRNEILHAIAAHTTPKIYHLYSNTLPFLLILCDEMQEWNRPTFSDFRTGARGRATSVTLNYETDEDNNVSIEFLAVYEKITYDSELYLAEKMFSGWYERLRYALDDAKRAFKFVWTLQFGEKTKKWEFKFDSSNKKTYDIVQLNYRESDEGSLVDRTMDDLKEHKDAKDREKK